MKCKYLFILSLLLLAGNTAEAQVSNRTNVRIQSYETGIQEVELTFSTFIMGIDTRGQISFIEALKKGRSANIRNLDVVYYDDFSSAKSGKIKSIDGVPFDYYSEYDIHDKKGTLKSVGSMTIQYNNAFDIHDIKGTIKSIGSINIKYNNAFDIHDIKGTVKSVGPINVNWYNKFDAENLRGRIKSIKGNTPTLQVSRIPTRI